MATDSRRQLYRNQRWIKNQIEKLAQQLEGLDPNKDLVVIDANVDLINKELVRLDSITDEMTLSMEDEDEAIDCLDYTAEVKKIAAVTIAAVEQAKKRYGRPSQLQSRISLVSLTGHRDENKCSPEMDSKNAGMFTIKQEQEKDAAETWLQDCIRSGDHTPPNGSTMVKSSVRSELPK